MKKGFVLSIMCWLTICVWGQEDYVLETRYRNPVDTMKFQEQPTILLFVHTKCQHGHLCPTTRMQKALESDSLGFRKKYNIKLYVIYPSIVSQYDINVFDSFSPTEDAQVAFYTKSDYKGVFQEGSTTPYIIFYDGKGHIHTKTGGTIEELKDSVENTWRFERGQCPVCHGTGSISPQRYSGDPDLSVGICRRCSGGIIGRKENY